MLTIKYILLVIPFFVLGQDYKKEVLSATANMMATSTYTVKVDYRLYLDGETKKAFQQSYMKLSKHGSNVFYKSSEGLECIANADYQVKIDNINKKITAKKNTADTDKSYTYALSNLDSMLAYSKSSKIIHSSAQEVTYEFTFSTKVAIEKMLVRLNKTRNMPDMVRYEYRQTQAISELSNSLHKVAYEINYTSFYPGVNAAEFNEQRYFTTVAGQLKTTAEYKNYKLTIY
jgi:hypothetical protein